jgi:AraC family transcriptional regulator, arabinose operon regulatory protein
MGEYMKELRDSITSNKNISLYIPNDIAVKESNNLFLRNLIITKIGYFHRAYNHSIHREGINEYIILYCIDGKGWVIIGDKKRQVNKGDLVFCDINCAHGYGADNSNPWSIYWIHFMGEIVPDLFKILEVSPQTPILSLGEKSKIISLIHEINVVLTNGYSFPNLFYASTYFQELFCYLVKLKLHSGLHKADSIDVESVMDFMLKNISSTCSLEDFADYMKTSKYHFARRFKEKTGYSPMDYFNRLKIQKACELLDTSLLSIKEISGYLSYKNPFYFSEVFKRITGYSPKEYRNILKNS